MGRARTSGRRTCRPRTSRHADEAEAMTSGSALGRSAAAIASTVSTPRRRPVRSTTIPVWTSASSIIDSASFSVVRRSSSGDIGVASDGASEPVAGMCPWLTQPIGRSDASSSRRYGNGSASVRVRASPAGSPTRAVTTGWSASSPTRVRERRLRPRSAPTKSATNADAGAARISAGGANCSRCPPTCMTATRSPILIASSMSCVTNRIVFASSACRRRNSFWSRSRTIGSTAPNGSSISIRGGSAASARATPTRCRSPPESWAG